MPEQLWLAPLKRGNIAAAPTVSNFTQLTQISPTPDAVIPANYMDPGTAILIQAWGRLGTVSTPTWTLGLYAGGVAGVALATTTAMVAFNNASNHCWTAEFTVICATEGTSGTYVTGGKVTGIVSTTAINNIPNQSLRPTATVDTTAAKAIVLGASCQTNNASNQITVDGWIVIA